MEKTWNDKVADVNKMRDIQGQDGNWNYDDYMRGLYNGLEAALAVLEERDPVYKETLTKELSNMNECVNKSTAPELSPYDVRLNELRTIMSDVECIVSELFATFNSVLEPEYPAQAEPCCENKMIQAAKVIQDFKDLEDTMRSIRANLISLKNRAVI